MDTYTQRVAPPKKQLSGRFRGWRGLPIYLFTEKKWTQPNLRTALTAIEGR
jgi:hypothetical protein